nr:hypothetical protein L204_01237 [Cryptococcus depauperatus CBS 7855]
MPYISTEILVGAVFLIAVVIATNLYLPDPSLASSEGIAKSTKKKARKKGGGGRETRGAVVELEEAPVKENKARGDDGMYLRENRSAPVAQSEEATPLSLPERDESGPGDDQTAESFVGVSEDTSRQVEEDWNVVPRKKKPDSLDISSRHHPLSTSLALPVATKGQKKNAKKAQVKKAQREAEEADRLKRLAMHKKELERERINELYTAHKKPQASRDHSTGAKASVTTNGKLVWD